jgi:hypothetical protein
MRKLPVIIAAASALFVSPVLAAPPESGSHAPIGESEHMNRDFGSTRGGGLGSSLGESSRSYGYEREDDLHRDRDGDMHNMHRHGGEGDWRYRHAEGMGMREGCKYITVRQRQGDEIIVRHFRRCD